VSDQILIQVNEAPQSVSVEVREPQVIEVQVSPIGLPGPQGPQGPPGVSGGSYLHTQSVPATAWTINHNLGYYPNITIVDSSKREVICEIEYVSVNQAIATFAAAFAGWAYVS
jgi:hypothetical protein